MNSSTEYSFVPTERPGAPALDAPHVAMLFIDAQKYTAERHSPLATAERRDFDNDYFYTRLDTTVKPNWATLVDVCRAAGVDIVSTIISSQRKDGKDLSRDYKATGFRVYAPRPVDELVDELKPASQNEIVIPKSSSSVFCSTNIDTILRNLSTQTLDQCVDHAVRDACDLGYSVVLVEDACATGSQARHDAAISAFMGYTDAIISTEEVVARLQTRVPNVLVTGFGPFGDVTVNPTALVVDALEMEGVTTRLISVSIQDVDEFIVSEMEPLLRHASGPISILHLGVAELGTSFRLESTAWNECTFRIPDGRGSQPVGQPICANGPASRRSTAPLEHIAACATRNDGETHGNVRVEISEDPGRYVCNYLYYRSLQAIAEIGADAKAVFAHVPPLDQVGIEDQVSFVESVCVALQECASASESPSLPLEVIALDDESIDDVEHAVCVRSSLLAHGFFLVRPPFPWSVVTEHAAMQRQFFDLPQEQKEKLAMSKDTMCGWHGATEKLDPSAQVGDRREGIYLRRQTRMPNALTGANQWPDLPGYRKAVLRYMDLMLELSARLTSIMAIALGLERDAFDEFFLDPMLTLRPINYMPIKSDEKAGVYAAGAHTDYGWLTILHAEPVDGLQVLREGRWRPVGDVGEALIVNVGDMGEAITGFKSTRHRVINKRGEARLSVPAFIDPSADSRIRVVRGSTLSTTSSSSGDEIVVLQYLLEKYATTHG